MTTPSTTEIESLKTEKKKLEGELAEVFREMRLREQAQLHVPAALVERVHAKRLQIGNIQDRLQRALDVIGQAASSTEASTKRDAARAELAARR